MKVDFNPEEVVVARVALVVVIAAYIEFARKAEDEGERRQMSQYADSARAMKGRLVTSGEIELEPADLVLFERACRMSASASQVQIKPGMDRADHAVLMAEVKEANDLFTKVRRARGLPW